MYYISAGLTFLWWAFPSSDNDEEEDGEDGDDDIKCSGLLFGWFSSTTFTLSDNDEEGKDGDADVKCSGLLFG